MVAPIAIVLGGLMLFAVTGWSWRGRSDGARWWVVARSSRRLVLGVAPGLAVLLLSGGLLTLAENHSTSVFNAAALVLALPMLAAVVLELVSIVGLLPKWWGPKWYRELVRTERRKPFRGW